MAARAPPAPWRAAITSSWRRPFPALPGEQAFRQVLERMEALGLASCARWISWITPQRRDPANGRPVSPPSPGLNPMRSHFPAAGERILRRLFTPPPHPYGVLWMPDCLKEGVLRPGGVGRRRLARAIWQIASFRHGGSGPGARPPAPEAKANFHVPEGIFWDLPEAVWV